MFRVSNDCGTPSSLMLLLTVSVYLSRGRTSPVMNKPEEKPPRKNSSAIDRSEPAQNGHDPIIDLAVVLGERPTPTVSAFEAMYCKLPKSSVCCVVGRDQSVML